MLIDTTKIDQLFRQAVNDGVAVGFQYVVFNKDDILSSKAAGLSHAASDADPEGVPLLPETPLNLASCGKLMVSIVALAVLERGMTHNGMTLADLDDHDKLVQVLPEFGEESDSWVGKIFVGFEPGLGPDGKKTPILRNPTVKVTLRHLFTHAAGHPYAVSHSSN